MKLTTVYDILFNNHSLNLPSQNMKMVEECHAFLESFAKDKVIYGINTGFGPMAQWRVDDKFLKDLQYNIIPAGPVGNSPLGDIVAYRICKPRNLPLYSRAWKCRGKWRPRAARTYRSLSNWRRESPLPRRMEEDIGSDGRRKPQTDENIHPRGTILHQRNFRDDRHFNCQSILRGKPIEVCHHRRSMDKRDC